MPTGSGVYKYFVYVSLFIYKPEPILFTHLGRVALGVIRIIIHPTSEIDC